MTGLGELDHLTDDDLALLAGVAGVDGLAVGPDRSRAVARLRAEPELVRRLLGEPAAFRAVFGQAADADPFLRASPFLVFALAVHRSAEDLRQSAFAPEWLGPRQRVAVFDVAELRAFLDHPAYRLYLAQLLASYTHVASGSVWHRTSRGWRRRRFSELDPVRLAAVLDVVPEVERAGIYRRLGDLALFLTGVFPDHTAVRALGQVDAGRLLRSAGLAPDAGPDGAVALLEVLGRRWYRLACRAAPFRTGDLEVVGEIAERFSQARRILNLVTDRYLFPFRQQWAAEGGA